MTPTAGLIFTAVIAGLIVAVLFYRRHRVGSFERAIRALGGRSTRPGPLPASLDWAGTEIIAARAIELMPGVPATLVALMRSAVLSSSADFGFSKADPFLVLRLPAEAVADPEGFRAALAGAVALDSLEVDDTGHAVAVVRALHTGGNVAAFIDAARAGLDAPAAG